LKPVRIRSVAFETPGVASRDAILSPAERAAKDTMMIFCSGAKTGRPTPDL
jgi:hypothetical protein